MMSQNESSTMGHDREMKIRMAQEAQAVIEFEEDPHRAALEDNPENARVSIKAWIAIFVRKNLLHLRTRILG